MIEMLIDLFGIILLSIIQGISEFLPISSSAHLIIARDVFKIGTAITEDMALSFDLAVHLGTLVAVIIYFWSDLKTMIYKGLKCGVKDKEGRVLWLIAVATIPAALAGVFFEEIIETIIRGNLYIIATALAFMGIIIYAADQYAKNDKSINDLNFKKVLFIGFLQIFALIPGFSRSGTTITAGRLLNLERGESAKFSFLMLLPITGGAIVYKSLNWETVDIVMNNSLIFIIGIIVAFITGYFVIGFLLKYLKKHDFKIFMWYRLALAAIVFAYLIFI